MDNNNEKGLSHWVDERLSTLDTNENWQPDVAAGLGKLQQKLSAKRWSAPRLIWVAASAVAVLLVFLVLPSPHVLAHKCLECSVAVWQSFASATSPQASIIPQEARKIAPDFSLKDADGKEVRLVDLKGKVVLVNFWATWCDGCQVEIPWFIEFQKKYAGRDFVVVGISLDDDGWKSVRPWLKEKKVNYSIVIGEQALGKQYGLDGMPLTVLVDREGRIADTHPGIVDQAATDQKIQALLK